MARRAKGEGSYRHILPVKCEKCKAFDKCQIRLNPTGKCRKRDHKEFWRYQYHVPGIDGKPIRKILEAKTYKELVARVEQMRLEKGSVSNDTITVGQWCDQWRDVVLPGTVKKSTLDSYKFMLSYVTDSVRKKRLAKLTPIDLQTMFAELKEHGSKKTEDKLSSTTVRGIRSTLITCFQSAIDNGFLIINVAKKTKPLLNNDRREISFLTEGEMLRLLEVADSGEYYDEQARDDDGAQYLIKQWSMVIWLTLATGMRRGEVFGLTWSAVNFRDRTISIKANLQGGKLEKPKTKYSIRTISVDADTLQKLKEWKEYQERFAYDLDDLYNNHLGTVFTGMFGGPVQLDNFRERVFKRIIAKAGLADNITLHSLRHTHATQLLAAGVDAKTVSKRLGHSSVAFTLQTYVHVVEEVERGAADTMGAILAGKKVRKPAHKC